MRKICYLLFLILTFYLAGMYRVEVLNLLVLSEIFLFISLFFITKYFVKKIDAKIQVNSVEVNKENVIKGKVIVTNETWLPITRFCIKIEYFNIKVSKTAIKKIKGYVPAKSKAEMEFMMKSKYCGILHLRIKEIKVYDYLSLFNRRKNGKGDLEVLVLPSGRKIRTELEKGDCIYYPPDVAMTSEELISQPPEILCINTYKPGDSMRDIHWKLSARNDNILIKKYSSDIENRISFFIDMRNERKVDIGRREAFYEVCSAISLGLIGNKISHCVRWYDKDKLNIVDRIVRTEEDYINMMEELMLKEELIDENLSGEEYLKNIYLHENNFETVIYLNLELKVFLNKQELMQFSEENYVKEIERRCLTV